MSVEDATRKDTMSQNIHAEPVGHGNSPAAWTLVFIMMIGAGISSVAFCLANAMLFWIGIAVMGLGLVVGIVMKKAGYGVNGHKLTHSGH